MDEAPPPTAPSAIESAEALSHATRVHGTLVQVAGVGVLLLGQSRIGKSECAVELAMRGARFVADDVVLLRREDARLVGEGPAVVRHLIELRGIGIVHLPTLLGPGCVLDASPIELVVELTRPGEDDVERIGLEREACVLGGVAIPRVRLPVAPGRNIAALVDVAARDLRSRQSGVFTAHALDARIHALLAPPERSGSRGEGAAKGAADVAGSPRPGAREPGEE
jgi:HPr kinase/phosphorylase